MGTTGDDMDPAQSGRRANELLAQVVERLDKIVDSSRAPTHEASLVQAKGAAEPATMVSAFAMNQPFVSQAQGPPPGTPESGVPGGYGSEPASMRSGQEQNDQLRKPFSRQGQHASQSVPGMTEGEVAGIEEESYSVPQYGKYQLDAYLRMARKHAVKKAGEEPPGESGEPGKWASRAERLTPAIEKTQEAVAAYQGVKSYVKPALDIGFGTSGLGASLGYSPQAGGTLGASHILGIPNPIAAFSSPAGRQGMGTLVNAAEASIGGTGIGMGEAKDLREGLASRGWSNERQGGLLGSTIGGNQENIALALEPAVKKGLDPTVAAEFGESLKLGTGNLKELKEVVDELGKTAITTNQTLTKTAEGIQQYGAKAVEHGSTMIQGMKTANTIGQETGMNPTIIQGINESNFGKVQALSKKVMPWEIQGMSAPASSLNAYETLQKVEGFVPAQKATWHENTAGEQEEVESAEAKKYARIHQLDPAFNAEYAKRLHEIGPRLKYEQTARTQAKKIEEHISQTHMANIDKDPASGKLKGEVAGIETAEKAKKAAEAQFEKEGGAFHGNQKALDKATGDLAKRKEQLRVTEKSLQAAREFTQGQSGNLVAELHKHEGIFEQAKYGGVDKNTLAKIEKQDSKTQPDAIVKALEKVNKVNAEKEAGENAKVELGPTAAKFFKMKWPDQYKKAANEGQASTTSKAAQPTSSTEASISASVNKEVAANVSQQTGRPAPAYYSQP
jgi:hypothetical protein